MISIYIYTVTSGEMNEYFAIKNDFLFVISEYDDDMKHSFDKPWVTNVILYSFFCGMIISHFIFDSTHLL